MASIDFCPLAKRGGGNAHGELIAAEGDHPPCTERQRRKDGDTAAITKRSAACRAETARLLGREGEAAPSLFGQATWRSRRLIFERGSSPAWVETVMHGFGRCEAEIEPCRKVAPVPALLPNLKRNQVFCAIKAMTFCLPSIHAAAVGLRQAIMSWIR